MLGGTHGMHTQAGGDTAQVCTGAAAGRVQERRKKKYFLRGHISDRCRHKDGTPVPPVQGALFVQISLLPSLDLYITYVSKLGNIDPGHDSAFLSLSSIVRGPVSSIVLYLGGLPIGWYGCPIFMPTPVQNTPPPKTRMQGNIGAILPSDCPPPAGGRGARRLCVGTWLRPGVAPEARNRRVKVQKKCYKTISGQRKNSKYEENTQNPFKFHNMK